MKIRILNFTKYFMILLVLVYYLADTVEWVRRLNEHFFAVAEFLASSPSSPSECLFDKVGWE